MKRGIERTAKLKTESLLDAMCVFSWQQTDDESNKRALDLLKQFLPQYRQVKLETKLSKLRQRCFSDYMTGLFQVRNALFDKRYDLACHEIISLNHHYNLYSPPVHANVIKLLEELF